MKNNSFSLAAGGCLRGVCSSHACFVMQISLKMVLPVHLKYVLELFYHEISFLRHWLSWEIFVIGLTFILIIGILYYL